METIFLLSIAGGFKIHFHPVDLFMGVDFFLLLLLLFGSAIISGSEAAFFSLTPSDLKKIEKSTGRKNELILELLEKPDILLVSLQMWNKLINISIVILSAFIVNTIIDFSQAEITGLLFQLVVISLLLLIFGEILPKLFATQSAYRICIFIAIPIYYLILLVRPVSRLMTHSSHLVGRKIKTRKSNFSMDDLSNALELAGNSMEEEKQILKGIVKFGNIDVRDIMRSRVDIVATDIRTPFSKLVQSIVESGYSRIPVYSESIDNIRGILYIKDLLPHLHKNDSFKWQSLIRPQFYVPETKKISDLLKEFQKSKNHIAVVIDEYGGTSGIVTLEDILEEIIGEIIDESDESEDIQVIRMDDANFLFEGKTLLNDFYKIMGTPYNIFDDVKGDADTLAGFILEMKGEMPYAGDVVEYAGFRFLIDSVDHRRINKIKVTILERP